MSAQDDHTRYVVTREEYTTMRAAVERCAELEAALAKVTAGQDEARIIARVWRRECLAPPCWDRPIAPRDLFPWERATPTEAG